MSASRAASSAPSTNVSRPGRSTGVDHARQTVLDDRDHAVVQHVDLALIDVTAGHTVPEVGEAGSGRQADVAGTYHAESNHGLLRHLVDSTRDHARETRMETIRGRPRELPCADDVCPRVDPPRGGGGTRADRSRGHRCVRRGPWQPLRVGLRPDRQPDAGQAQRLAGGHTAHRAVHRGRRMDPRPSGAPLPRPRRARCDAAPELPCRRSSSAVSGSATASSSTRDWRPVRHRSPASSEAPPA